SLASTASKVDHHLRRLERVGVVAGLGAVGDALALVARLLQLTAASSDVSVSDDGTSLTFTTTSTGADAFVALSAMTSNSLGFGTSAQTVYGKNAIAAGSGTVIADEAAAFTKESLDGGSVTVYDPQGSAVDVQFRWAKMSEGPDTWN
ncbi:hypothetical protein J8J27_22255, partial [Mycobacterium tuberculosis]|nr:hypothetical protein [Mycobacterium tuberculosis]